MPNKSKKSIPVRANEELKQLGIELLNYKTVTYCPYCYEVHQVEAPAVQHPKISYWYSCGDCALVFSMH